MADNDKALKTLDKAMDQAFDLYHSLSTFTDYLSINVYLAQQNRVKSSLADIQDFIDGVRKSLLLEIHKEQLSAGQRASEKSSN